MKPVKITSDIDRHRKCHRLLFVLINLGIIYANEKVIGIDITGECSATLDYLSEVRSADINNRANEELMRMILAEER